MLTHLFSFVGIEEEATLNIDNELPLALISKDSTQVNFIDFWYARSTWKCHTHA